MSCPGRGTSSSELGSGLGGPKLTPSRDVRLKNREMRTPGWRDGLGEVGSDVAVREAQRGKGKKQERKGCPKNDAGGTLHGWLLSVMLLGAAQPWLHLLGAAQGGE